MTEGQILGHRPGATGLSLQAASSNVRLVELDGIRGIAVLFILIWHYIGIPMGIQLQPDRWIPNFHSVLIIFKSGVDLFFTLSGFLIAGILIESREAPTYYRTFFVRRVCRIFPLYYTLVFVFIVARLAGAGGPLFAGSIPFLAAHVAMLLSSVAITEWVVWMASKMSPCSLASTPSTSSA